jgi:hypothetical protein
MGTRACGTVEMPATRDGPIAAAISAWRASPLILTPAQLPFHLLPWAERPIPDSKERRFAPDCLWHPFDCAPLALRSGQALEAVP